MKILSYNIMSGGFSGYDYSLKAPQRLDLIKKVVANSGANIVSLIDTFRWDEIYTNEQIAKIFGYKNAHCINLNDERLRKLGHNNGITVLSNLDNIKFETISLGSRDCVKCEFSNNGKNTQLFSLYLDDLSEDVRVSQISYLLGQLNDSDATLIAGDLNTFSPRDSDDTKKRVNDFILKNPKFSFLKNQFMDMARAEAAEKLLSDGFEDASKSNDCTAPTKLLKLVDRPILRLDYCFYKNISVKNFEVLTGNIYEAASDHFPILIEFEAQRF